MLKLWCVGLDLIKDFTLQIQILKRTYKGPVR